MTREDINDIINAICPNDEDFEKACISPAYLKKELEVLALEQEPCSDTISKTSVFEILGNLMSIPYDFDRQITEQDVSESMDEIRALPPVTPKGVTVTDFADRCMECGARYGKQLEKLERESMLDEIRAKIELQRKEACNKHSKDDELQSFYFGLGDGLKDARDILDEYKTRMEEELKCQSI